MALNVRAVVAEFLAMVIFVFVCAGAATGSGGSYSDTASFVQQIALTFGFCITVLAYTIGHYSGGHINCAVTLGLVVAGACEPIQGACNFLAQLIGAIVGAALIALVKQDNDNPANDKTKGLGANKVNVGEGIENYQAMFAEMFATFVLMYTVLETAVNPKTSGNRMMAAVAIGLAVYVAHSLMIPIDGCSINPTRSFGPAVVASMKYPDGPYKFEWDDHWVFWVGPCLGSLMAVGMYKLMNMLPAGDESTKPAETELASA